MRKELSFLERQVFVAVFFADARRRFAAAADEADDVGVVADTLLFMVVSQIATGALVCAAGRSATLRFSDWARAAGAPFGEGGFKSLGRARRCEVLRARDADVTQVPTPVACGLLAAVGIAVVKMGITLVAHDASQLAAACAVAVSLRDPKRPRVARDTRERERETRLVCLTPPHTHARSWRLFDIFLEEEEG